MNRKQLIDYLYRWLLWEIDNLSLPEDHYCWLRTLVTDEFSIELLRVIAGELRNKGFLEFRKGLMNEDGEVAGSGYAITSAGRACLDQLIAKDIDQ